LAKLSRTFVRSVHASGTRGHRSLGYWLKSSKNAYFSISSAYAVMGAKFKEADIPHSV
jgi:hypothetical protein